MDEWLGDTRRVIQMGGKGLGVHIKKDISDALEIVKGSLVEVRIRNTGKVATPIVRNKLKEIANRDDRSQEVKERETI